jgi:hypothetical protein
MLFGVHTTSHFTFHLPPETLSEASKESTLKLENGLQDDFKRGNDGKRVDILGCHDELIKAALPMVVTYFPCPIRSLLAILSIVYWKSPLRQ